MKILREYEARTEKIRLLSPSDFLALRKILKRKIKEWGEDLASGFDPGIIEDEEGWKECYLKGYQHKRALAALADWDDQMEIIVNRYFEMPFYTDLEESRMKDHVDAEASEFKLKGQK